MQSYLFCWEHVDASSAASIIHYFGGLHKIWDGLTTMAQTISMMLLNIFSVSVSLSITSSSNSYFPVCPTYYIISHCAYDCNKNLRCFASEVHVTLRSSSRFINLRSMLSSSGSDRCCPICHLPKDRLQPNGQGLHKEHRSATPAKRSHQGGKRHHLH